MKQDTCLITTCEKAESVMGALCGCILKGNALFSSYPLALPLSGSFPLSL